MRRLALWVTAVVVGVLAPTSVLARAAAPAYVTSDPANGATVESAPSRVSVTFSEPLDSSSTLQVFDQCGQAVDSGDEQVLGSRIDVGLAATPAGHYTAVYLARGFGGATGETKGSFSFHVTSGEPCGEEHGGHDGHDGGSDGNGHGGHGGKGDGHGAGDGGHEGDHGGSGHSGESHESTAHDGHRGNDDHSEGRHDGSGHHRGDRHQRGNGESGHSERHGNGSTDEGDLTELASDRDGLGLAPTSTSVIIALTLSVVMGALGGWVLRVSAGS